MIQSTMTNSGLCSATRSTASRPFFAKIRKYCLSERAYSTSLRETAESSAISIFTGCSAFGTRLIRVRLLRQRIHTVAHLHRGHSNSLRGSGRIRPHIAEYQDCSRDADDDKSLSILRPPSLSPSWFSGLGQDYDQPCVLGHRKDVTVSSSRFPPGMPETSKTHVQSDRRRMTLGRRARAMRE